MKSYDTVSQAMKDLNKMGYDAQFDLNNDSIMDVNTGKKFKPGGFSIIDNWRFEGMSNPADNMILYTLEAGGKKGTLLETFGPGATAINEEMRNSFTKS